MVFEVKPPIRGGEKVGRRVSANGKGEKAVMTATTESRVHLRSSLGV